MGNIIKTESRSGFYRIPDDGLGYYLGRRAAGRLWGQPFIILFLIELGERWFPLSRNRPFGIGDIAEENAGSMPDHQTHRHGSAVDLFIFHKDGLKRDDRLNGFSFREPEKYDQETTLQFVTLIKEFSLRYGMQQILYNDNEVNSEANKAGGYPPVKDDSKTERSKGQHDDHIHITFTGLTPYGMAPYKNKEIIEVLERKGYPALTFSPDMCRVR